MLKYALKSKDGQWYYPATKMKIYALAVRELEKLGQIYCRVSYGKDRYNHATVYNKNQLKRFVSECTEPELLKYMECL